MAGSIYGQLLRLSTFGESHGLAIGGVLDGMPPGVIIEIKEIQSQLSRRRPGQSSITTDRNEADEVEILSGIFEGKTTGTPIGFIIRNKDKRSGDYDHLQSVFRPSHADFTYEQKYGLRDHRGGGRSSARETAARVVAGSIAMQWLQTIGIEFSAYVSSVGEIQMKSNYQYYSEKEIDANLVRCPESAIAEKMIRYIQQLKEEGDSVGGIISCVIQGCPAGLGEPVFDKLHAELGKAMLSINAVKGFEIGSGFSGSGMRGSQHNDEFTKEGDRIITITNHSGGIQGGISNGMDIAFHTAFKPVATIRKSQQTIDTAGAAIQLEAHGRHDPCVVPRAVPIVASMAALVIGDFILRQRAIKA